MTIHSVNKMWSRNRGNHSTADFKTFTAGFQEAYQVVHSVDATLIEIMDAPGILLGDPYPGTDIVLCKNRIPEQVTPIFSIVTIDYEGEVGLSPDDSPLNKPPSITWQGVSSNEAADTDAFGVPFTNTIGDPVDGISREIFDFKLTIVRNFSFFATYGQSQYLSSTNSDFFGLPGDLWPPGTVSIIPGEFQIDLLKDRSDYYAQVRIAFGFRIPYNTIPARAWWKRYRNEGYYERVGVNVVFTGGGGTGASGYAVTNSSGAITRINITNGGRGYTSAPTVSVTSADGSGFSGSATLTGERVTGVTVSAGGSDYRVKRVRAYESGEPTVTPVLLAANGTRLEDMSSAFWNERPDKVYSLPYFAIGML
jgi:hypothetical protein